MPTDESTQLEPSPTEALPPVLAFGGATLAALTAIAPTLAPVAGVLGVLSALASVGTTAAGDRRLAAIEAQLAAIRAGEPKVQARLTRLEELAAQIQAAQHRGEVVVDAPDADVKSRDVRNAVAAFSEAASADDDELREGHVRAAVRALLGETRSQLDVMALAALERLTLDGLRTLRKVPREPVSAAQVARRPDRVDALVALGLVEVEGPMRYRSRDSFASGHQVRRTAVGTRVIELVHRFEREPERRREPSAED